MSRTLLWTACGLCLASALVSGLGAATAPLDAGGGKSASGKPAIDYSRQVRPILSANCFQCHGPDDKVRKSGLRLDLPESVLRGGDSDEPAVVPGKPRESQLIIRLTAKHGEGLMPPVASKKKLTPKEIELLTQWVEQGPSFKVHWAYLKPARPSLPAVKAGHWPRNAIDHFILARLEKAGLEPAPEADRATLIRRLSLDLIGLPPSIREVDDFLHDTRPGAYERVVDRLLASPHFGERMAQDWLDLARYGDTNGYENDSDRAIWKYRDWVIGAFNRNRPFDQFTIEQLAGDLLPGAAFEQKVATGFHRNVTFNEEQGSDPDEYLIKYAVDRVNTTASVFLGMTMGCAECHDHKYDPIAQKDFYSLLAFFNSVEGEKGAQGHDVPLPPLLSFPTPQQARSLAQTQRRLAEVEARIREEVSKVKIEEPSSLAAPVGAVTAAPSPGGQAKGSVNEAQHQEAAGSPHEYVWIDDDLPAAAVTLGREDRSAWKWGEHPNQPVFSRRLSLAQTARGVAQNAFKGASPGLNIGAGDKLFAHVYLDPKNPPKTVMLQFYSGTWEHRAYWGAGLPPSASAGETGLGVDKTPSRLPMGSLPRTGEWVRLEVDAQAIGLAPGSVVTGMSFTLVDGKVYWDRAGIVTSVPQASSPFDSQTLWEQTEKEKTASRLPPNITEAVRAAPGKRTAAQKKDLRAYFVQYVYSKTAAALAPLNRQQAELKAEEKRINNGIPTTMVMTEMRERRPTFVLKRGNYQAPGERVSPAVPAIFAPLPRNRPANRLGLAYWLVDRENPLVARVAVNRFWKQMFGTGLVKTAEDFGSQGEFPSHPELLDWLAVEFMSSAGEPGAWDIKGLLRKIGLSAAYRQSAQIGERAAAADPYNRLLSRGPRSRLPAEAIRDNVLAVSGLLNRALGGKSVYPYQPADYYRDKGRWQWPQSTGRDLYRRGLYVFWRRTTFYPPFQMFDAPTREVCVVDRPRTNTPLQALTTLNDPVFVEAARVFGQRIMQEGGSGLGDKMTFAFRTCLARSPSAAERRVLERVYGKQLARYRADRAAALALVKNGEFPRPASLDVAELAAWTSVGNLLLNLDETLTR